MTYWDPFVKYLNLLYWPNLDVCIEQRLRISFAEWVLDFEIWSGMRIEDPALGINTPWFRKAAIFRLMWRAAMKFGQLLRQEKTEFPQDRVTSLLVFGIPKIQGLLRRPKFLMGEASELLIAENALRYQEDAGIRKKNKSNDGLLDLQISYATLTRRPLYAPPELVQLAFELSLRQPGRRRIKGKKTPPFIVPPKERDKTLQPALVSVQPTAISGATM
jgi:hypothetical protein